ncbi:Arc family DNA-binding protein [Curvibacter sp. HBC28]|uniref:Arc family DNA-binding protein n=1 Tax=Curvibacter microcysteis TaxID=3026419 RepID=A0ABT5MCH0_9BURK|nr:Arc family DNA-binding protein [Curvibacter sp. HBC28]MDD0814258.1 Arc family DNA-binding protein [Curvibacter sp. HBC28]
MATSTKQTDFVKTALRLPPELHEQVHAAAQNSGRTYNAELVHCIEKALNPGPDAVSVHLDPKLRYLAEIAARKNRRTLASHIEWAVEISLREVVIYAGSGYNGDHSISVAERANDLWDVDESERFIKLAIRHPELLTLEEQERWKMLSDADLLAPARLRNPNGLVAWNFGRLDDAVYPTIRRIWPDLLAAHAAGPERSREWVASTRLAVLNGNIYPGYPPSPATRKAARPSSGFDDMDETPF